MQANPQDSPCTERFRIRCEPPPAATRLYRIAEVELLEEADDPVVGAECVQQHAQAVSLFSELMSRLASIGGIVATNFVGDHATIPNSLDKIENAVLINSIANTFNCTAKRNRVCWKKRVVVRASNDSAFFFASRSKNSTA
jgi:hypothetical protein